MLIVVDANVVFSALLNKGLPFEVFRSNKLFKKFEFITPEFLFTEIGKRLDKIEKQSKLSKEEISDIFSLIKKQISIIPLSEFSDKQEEAKLINFKDSPYLALALKYNCPVFSGDKKLKEQNKVQVLSPREIIDSLVE